MTLSVDFWDLLKLLIGFAAVLLAFGKLLFVQIDKRLDSQGRHIKEIEDNLANHQIRMPLEYQRREDAIRFETGINAKLDAIYHAIHNPRGAN